MKSSKIKIYLKVIIVNIFILAIAAGSSISSSTELAFDKIYKEEISVSTVSAQPLVLLRRLSYQIRGIPASLSEIRAFERANKNTRIRQFAIKFLRSPEYAGYWSGIFGSMLREQYIERGSQNGSFLKYITTSLHSNKPYNLFVSEMLTATGNSVSNPATGFYLRDDADPLQIAEYVGRTFYGSRLACARCHDHPFNRNFTRRDYYGFSAFFSQVYQMNRLKSDGIPRHRIEDLPLKYQKVYQEKQREWQRNVFNKMSKKQRKAYMKKNRLKYYEIAYDSNLSLRFPHTDDSPGGDLVKLKFPDGSRAFIEKGDDRREAFVEWLTGEENDRFRKVIINRIWTHYMGWSFFYPLDDLNQKTKIRHPKMLKHLDQYFLKNNYKLKELVLYIVSSKSWARRTASPKDSDKDNKMIYFAARRQDAAQIMNSLVVGGHKKPIQHIWERAGSFNLKGTGRLKKVKENRRDLSNACELARPAHSNTFLGVFGEGERQDIDDNVTDPTIDQVLALLNGRVTSQVVNGMRDKNHWLQKDYQRHKDMLISIENLYLAMLGRNLNDQEKAFYKNYLKPKFSRQKKQFDLKIVQSAAWSIINSYEFIHIY